MYKLKTLTGLRYKIVQWKIARYSWGGFICCAILADLALLADFVENSAWPPSSLWEFAPNKKHG